MGLCDLTDDVLRNIIHRAGGLLCHALVSRAIKHAQRQLRATITLSDWASARKLRWALALPDLRLVLARVTDWDLVADAVRAGSSLKAITVMLDRYSLGAQDVSALAMAMEWNRWDGESYGVGKQAVATLVRLLQVCRCLQELDLAGCNLGPDGGGALSEGLSVAHALQTLDLDSNALGDSGAIAIVESIAQCSSLKELSLADNRIGVAGAKAISEAIKRSSIRELLLDSNRIGDQGCTFIAQALTGCPGLQCLGLSDNGIGACEESGFKALSQAIYNGAGLRTVDLSENGPHGSRALEELCAQGGVVWENPVESDCGDCGLCEDCALGFY